MAVGVGRSTESLDMRPIMGQTSPEQTLQFLATLDPQFGVEWEREAEPGEVTHHGLMQFFAQHFAHNHAKYSEKQLRRLGEWLSQSVASGGVIENAVSTCLLEHMRQLKINRVLAPYLSKEAKNGGPHV